MPEIDRDIKPEQVREIDRQESFTFRCHPGVACFNECCRLLELALSPYDVLRLKNNLGLSGREFLERYALIEEDDGGELPQIYLGMVDDGRASCPFVTESGCSVYADRPGACRTYPLGRGAFLGQDGTPQELFVLLSEPHCQGFSEAQQQNVPEWTDSQDLARYNHYNDLVMAILQHPRCRQAQRFSRRQIDHFLLGLYDLEGLRAAFDQETIALPFNLSPEERQKLAMNDEALLEVGIRWVTHELFGR